MRTAAPPALPIFRSDLQARLLAVLLAPDAQPATASELRGRLGASAASLHRELERLSGAGIVEVERVGRTRRFRAARASPLVEPLRALVSRTIGVETELADALGRVPGVEAAAIYGSWARGAITPSSDIDVLVVGRAEAGEVYDAVHEAERLSGRDVDVRVFTADELRERAASGSAFLADVMSGPLTPLVGDLPDLA
jgi:predicted nucleotidyltransferase